MSDFNNISNSSGPGSSGEPSMEEILASIRRILKEDSSTLPAKVDIDDDVLLLDDSMLAKPADFSSGTELPPEPELIAPHPDGAGATFREAQHFSSEPTFAVDDYAADDATADHYAATHGDAAYQPPSAEPPPYQAPFEAEAEREPELEPEPAPAAPFAEQIVPYEPPASEPPPIAADEPVFHRQNPEETMSENVEPPHGMMSEEARSAAANSIGSLVRSISAERSVAVSRGGITIEDIVREEIRPVLKAWLDSHLPSLVERLVRSEIERVVDRGTS